MLTDLWQLFWSFAKIGIFGFGGGPSFVPLIQEEVVEVQRWLNQEEFLDAYALGNALPGPIATKLAGFIGYKVAGWQGAFMGVLGMVLPTAIAMIALFTLYLRFRESPAIGGFLRGVRPVVIALLFLVVWEFVPSAFGAPAAWAGNWLLWLMALAAFVLALRFDVHPSLLIVVGGVVGVALLRS